MGARNNKALREPKNKNAKAAALNKKFKKKPCSFCQQKVTFIDYKDIATLRKYISDRGKIPLAALQVHAHSTSVQSQQR